MLQLLFVCVYKENLLPVRGIYLVYVKAYTFYMYIHDQQTMYGVTPFL